MQNEALRRTVLIQYGASSSVVEELIEHGRNRFDHTGLEAGLRLPLPDEPFVAAWERYAAEAESDGVFVTLRRKLAPLRFPIARGISGTAAYRAATRRGVCPDEIPDATGLVLLRPEALRLELHQTLAGRIPVLITAERGDFVSLVRALAMRNEPEPVPSSMGAVTVSGLNNWDRIWEYRRAWEKRDPANRTDESWRSELQVLRRQPDQYQDRLIVLTEGPYSGVPAGSVGCSESEWRRLSLAIRLEHEAAHYFTRRVLAAMSHSLLDELIADYWGLVTAAGWFRAEWLLRFLGLESFPTYRGGGRLENYRGDPPLSEDGFRVLQALVHRAAANLETFSREHSAALTAREGRARALVALTYLTLEEMAADEASSRLTEAFDRTLRLVREIPPVSDVRPDARDEPNGRSG